MISASARSNLSSTFPGAVGRIAVDGQRLLRTVQRLVLERIAAVRLGQLWGEQRLDRLAVADVPGRDGRGSDHLRVRIDGDMPLIAVKPACAGLVVAPASSHPGRGVLRLILKSSPTSSARMRVSMAIKGAGKRLEISEEDRVE